MSCCPWCSPGVAPGEEAALNAKKTTSGKKGTRFQTALAFLEAEWREFTVEQLIATAPLN
jgi:hypothetical protein